MNRAQRRKFNKEHKTTYTKEEFEIAIALARLQSGTGLDADALRTLMQHGVAHLDNEELVPTGTEVKINADEILSRKATDYTEEYRSWVDEHKDDIFHLMREEGKNSLVCLEEDNHTGVVDGNEVVADKWLFDLYTDILVKDKDTNEWVPVYTLDPEFESVQSQEITEEENNGEENNAE